MRCSVSGAPGGQMFTLVRAPGSPPPAATPIPARFATCQLELNDRNNIQPAAWNPVADSAAGPCDRHCVNAPASWNLTIVASSWQQRGVSAARRALVARRTP